MRSLARVALSPDEIKAPLPTVFKALERMGAQPRRASTTMVVAIPGAGKTYWMLKYLQVLGLSTLYFSADTGAQDQLERASAMATGNRIEQIREDMLMGGDEYYSDILAENFAHIRWVFETDPTYDDIELEVSAYAEAYGEFPQIIVVDTLMNLVGDADSEYASQKDSTRVLHRLERVTGASVFLIHHANEVSGNTAYPPAQKDVANKLNQLPSLILSLASDGDVMRIAAVKNRGGPSDPSGKTFATIPVDLDRGAFFDSPWHKENGQPIT